MPIESLRIEVWLAKTLKQRNLHELMPFQYIWQPLNWLLHGLYSFHDSFIHGKLWAASSKYTASVEVIKVVKHEMCFTDFAFSRTERNFLHRSRKNIPRASFLFGYHQKCEKHQSKCMTRILCCRKIECFGVRKTFFCFIKRNSLSRKLCIVSSTYVSIYGQSRGNSRDAFF